eukprot:125983_1
MMRWAVMGCCQQNQSGSNDDEMKSIIVTDSYDLKLTECIGQEHKSIVYGYIRQIGHIIPTSNQSNYYLQIGPIPREIPNVILLFYFCMDRYPYKGDIEHWTKQALYDKYVPLKLHTNQGGFSGVVFEGEATWYHKARTIKYGNKVFLKKLTNIHHIAWPWGKMMLLRELRILRILFDHPSVIKLYDVLPPVDINSLNVIYEHTDAPLSRVFNTNQYFSELHCQYMLYHILLGVQWIHDSNIVHRDLRPDNILLNADCSLKITGFWSACGINEEIECKRKHIAAPWYRAPEIILLQLEDLKAADMWSVGCIFGELLQMIRVKPRQRKPLCQGNSCFFLSETNTVSGSQMHQIFKFIGCPSGAQMDWIIEPKAREYINSLRAAMFYRSGVDLCKVYPAINDDGLDLLRGLLRFDVAERLTAADALKSAYFDRVRDLELENKYLPKLYVGFKLNEYDRIHDRTLKKEKFNELLLEEIEHYN